MTTDKIRERMQEIAVELFEIANACATDDKDTSNAAIFLHEAVNNIWTAEKCLNGEDIPIPMAIIIRSMGMDMGKMMTDIADIADMSGMAGEKNED